MDPNTIGTPSGADTSVDTPAVPSNDTPTPSVAPATATSTGPAPVPNAPGSNVPLSSGQSVPVNTLPSSVAPNQDAYTHQSTIGKIFQAIAGGQTTDYVQTAKGPVPVKRNLRPGEMARNILASTFSLMAAGAGGDMAAREKRPYEQNPSQTIGGMREQADQQKQQQAQLQFKNAQEVNAEDRANQELVLRQHQDAREQQNAVAQRQKDADAHRASDQAYAVGSRELENADYDTLVKIRKDYDSELAMPGAHLFQDPQGGDLSFYDTGNKEDGTYRSGGQNAQAYVTAHPELVHGSTNGDSKFGTHPVINPWTRAWQIVDYPPDRHDVGIEYYGGKKDKNGQQIFDKDGSPIPNDDPKDPAHAYDPKTNKPTVLTDTVSANTARDIATKQLTDNEIRARISNLKSEANERDNAVKKQPFLDESLSLFNSGNLNKMNTSQRLAVAGMLATDRTRLSTRENQATQRVDRERAAVLKADPDANPDENPDVKAALSDLNSAKNEYDDVADQYNRVTGLTPGRLLANRIIRSGNLGNIDWNQVNALPQEEQEVAKATLWNAMTPQQKKALQPGRPAVTPPAVTPPAGKATLYDPSGTPHFVDEKLVDQYLKDPQYKGWTK